MTRHGWNISDYDAEIDRLKKRIVKLEANLAKAVEALKLVIEDATPGYNSMFDPPMISGDTYDLARRTLKEIGERE